MLQEFVMSPRASCRKLLIEAAEKVVVEAGAGHLTLDAVAAKAKVSKGGLMYHFPNKDALLRAMVAHLVERFDAMQAKEQSALGKQKGAILKSHVLTGVGHPELNRISAAMLAASANEPKLLAPVRDHHIKQFAQFKAAGLQFEQAAIVVLATSGLWLFELLKISPFSDKQRNRIIKKLMSLTENSSHEK
jgi:AcrR family transcriptional regulator